VSGDPENAARLAARDVSMFDQQGCLSIHDLYLTSEAGPSPRAFAELHSPVPNPAKLPLSASRPASLPPPNPRSLRFGRVRAPPTGRSSSSRPPP
jgi:hypothetical protein